MTPTVLILGASSMELTLNMSSLPAPGQERIDEGGASYLPRSSCAEIAAAFGALGARAVLFTKLGRDAHGKKLFDYYSKLSIDTGSIKVDPTEPTGLVANLEIGTDESRRILYPGANQAISAENVKEAFDRVRPDALFMTLDLPEEITLMAARYAAARSIPIFVDPASTDERILSLLPPLEAFFPNEHEVEAYTGILPLGVDISLRAALALYRKVKLKHLVFKMGVRGSFYYDGKHCDIAPPIAGVKIAPNTPSLGAIYSAAFTVCYLGGASPKDCMRYATAAAALAGSRGGGIESYPTSAEIIRFCHENQT